MKVYVRTILVGIGATAVKTQFPCGNDYRKYDALFPICILQPAMGFGVAFSRLPQTGFLLTKIIVIHIIYGLGLYFTATALKKIQNIDVNASFRKIT